MRAAWQRGPLVAARRHRPGGARPSPSPRLMAGAADADMTTTTAAAAKAAGDDGPLFSDRRWAEAPPPAPTDPVRLAQPAGPNQCSPSVAPRCAAEQCPSFHRTLQRCSAVPSFPSRTTLRCSSPTTAAPPHRAAAAAARLGLHRRLVQCVGRRLRARLPRQAVRGRAARRAGVAAPTEGARARAHAPPRRPAARKPKMRAAHAC